ncbi:hypothetical protein MJG53_010767 [Ovis ammon polii x Ovis aries]|uniref:Uncharacterized protein n=1 Tax=Ovis ammon polii x Ovis aries TaxID=2918886 RepID=A0ACB9URL1_9CETA|nr:hypothetical protein MJG53_010767 [Ovis ammon polii x Ovis aries]
MRDLFAVCPGKISGRSWRISRGGALHRKGERNSSVVPPFPESPRSLSPFQRNLFSLHCLDSHAEDRLQPRWHVGQPCGKASWESHRSLDPLDRKRDTAATALEESASACPHSRRGLTPLGRLQTYPKIHVSTGEESSGSGPDSTQGLRPRHRRERNPERPPRNSHGDWPFLRPPERVPEGPVPRIDSHHVCTWDSPVGKPRGKASWESLLGKIRGKTIDPLIHAADCVTLLLPLWRKAQVHARIRDED